ncbi:MAG: MlaD family protein [Planctomycetota bacterium]|jgi:ABC-type transporter Mla subunit MlaD
MELKPRPLERGVGVAILAALLILVVGVLLSTQGREFFRTYKDAVFVMENGQGIRKGTPVTVIGLPAGVVDSVEPHKVRLLEELEGTGQAQFVDHVKVTVRIYSPYDDYLRHGSQVKVILPFIMGSTTIDVIPGPYGAAPLESGGLLEKDIVKGLGGKVETFIDTGNKVLTNFEGISGNLERAVADIAGITNKINYGQNTLGEILNDDRKLYNQILTLLNNADTAANNFNSLARDLKEVTAELPEIVFDLKKSASSLKSTSQNALEISTDMRELPKDLSKTLSDVERSVNQLQVFTDDLAPFGKELKRFAQDDMPVMAKLIADAADAAVLMEVASRDFPSVMQRTKDTLAKTEAITLAVKGTWPISGNLPPKGYVPQTILIGGRSSSVVGGTTEK